MEKDNAKSYRPISFLNCIGKILEKVAVARVAYYIPQIGTIDNIQAGSSAGISVQDALICLLTPAQEWLFQRNTYRKACSQPIIRPTIPANNIDNSFNIVHHKWLTDVITNYGFLEYIVNWTKDFCTNKTLGFCFQRGTKTP